MVRRLFQITVGTIAGLAVVAVTARMGWLPLGRSPDPDPHILAASFPAPALRLTTHSGRPFELKPGEGPTVVFFGYTHCPDVCPVTLANLRRAVDSLEGAGPVRVLFVTVDPRRDSPARLSTYLAPLQPGFTGLTGTEEEISAAASDWGIFRDVPAGETDYVVDHTARSFVVDGRGRVRATFPPGATAEAMARTLHTMLEGD